MSDCEYVRNYYGVPACIGRLVIYKGEQGVISRDGGNYICVNFDKDKPGVTCNIHPTDPNIIYEGIGKVRKLTRSQQRYQDYISSDLGLTFFEWIMWKSRVDNERT